MSTAAPAVVSNFNFNTSSIRVVNIEDAPWFVAADVCNTLGMGMAKGTFKWLQALDATEKARVPHGLIGGKGGNQLTLISESGLYKLIMRSDKPEAKGFQDWVTKVVLPAIRKDGGYVKGEEKVVTGEMSMDEFILKAMQMQAAKVERLKAERDAAVAQVVKLEEKVVQIVGEYETTDTTTYCKNVLGFYPTRGETSLLGKAAMQCSLSDNVQPKQVPRTLASGKKVFANCYQRRYLDKAAQIMGFINRQ